MSNKHLYWAYQSSQSINPTEEELKTFQNKYKKDYEQRELYEDEELENKFRLNAWRNPLFSEITSIILAFEHQDTLRVQYITGTEKDLLQNFVNLVKTSFQDYVLVHFDAEIVLPYLGVRLNSNGHLTAPHNNLIYQGHNFKPWNLTGLDIKQWYKGAGRYTFSLEEIAKILSIDKEGIIPYEDEFTYFNSNDFDSLKSSAIKKVEVLSQIHRKLFGLNSLTTVLVEEQVKDVEEYKPTDWLKELGTVKQLTLEIKEGLKSSFFSKKKMTKKDKEIAFDLIKAGLSDIDQNFGKVKNEAEVEQIINQLKQEFENN